MNDDELLQQIVNASLQRLQAKGFSMTPDNRKTPSYHHIQYFKARAKAYLANKTEGGRRAAAASMDSYLRSFKDLEQYDPRTKTENVMSKDNSSNYIEIKQGGVTFRKSSDKLTIICNHTMDYTESNLKLFNNTIAAGLEVIAAASKFDLVVQSTPPKGVEL